MSWMASGTRISQAMPVTLPPPAEAGWASINCARGFLDHATAPSADVDVGAQHGARLGHLLAQAGAAAGDQYALALHQSRVGTSGRRGVMARFLFLRDHATKGRDAVKTHLGSAAKSSVAQTRSARATAAAGARTLPALMKKANTSRGAWRRAVAATSGRSVRRAARQRRRFEQRPAQASRSSASYPVSISSRPLIKSPVDESRRADVGDQGIVGVFRRADGDAMPPGRGRRTPR